MKYLLLFVFLVSCVHATPITINVDNNNNFTTTTVKTKNVTIGEINYKILSKPHHLFIGRCNSKHPVLHQENIILKNDGKSHVSANIRVNIDGPVYITCVNVYDEVPNGEGGYPSFSKGGVGYSFVEFDVLTNYGKGFHFFIQIFGYNKPETSQKLNLPRNTTNL